MEEEMKKERSEQNEYKDHDKNKRSEKKNEKIRRIRQRDCRYATSTDKRTNKKTDITTMVVTDLTYNHFYIFLKNYERNTLAN